MNELQLDAECIRRTFHGGTDNLSYDLWVTDIIQDEEAAFVLAESMLAHPQDAYAWNIDQHPRHYETFFIINEEVFRACVERAKEEMGL